MLVIVNNAYLYLFACGHVCERQKGGGGGREKGRGKERERRVRERGVFMYGVRRSALLVPLRKATIAKLHIFAKMTT